MRIPYKWFVLIFDFSNEVFGVCQLDTFAKNAFCILERIAFFANGGDIFDTLANNALLILVCIAHFANGGERPRTTRRIALFSYRQEVHHNFLGCEIRGEIRRRASYTSHILSISL